MRRLNEAGVPCGVLVAPVLPGLSDRPEQLEAVVAACVDAGATSISPVLLHLRPGVREHYLRTLAETRPDLVELHERRYARGAYGPKEERERVSRLVHDLAPSPFHSCAGRARQASRATGRTGGRVVPLDRHVPGAARPGTGQPGPAGSGPVTWRTCSARPAARRRRPTPGSAPRAGRRWWPGPTSAASPRCCSPTWSASRALPRPPIPSSVKNLVDRCFERARRRHHGVRRPGRQDRRRRASSRCSARRSPTRTTPSGRCGPRCRCSETLSRPATRARRRPVQMRIGVNTGEVLVGALRAGGDYTAMGDVVNIAQPAADRAREPGQVVVGPATYAATQHVVRYEALGLGRPCGAATSRSTPGSRSRRCCRPGDAGRRARRRSSVATPRSACSARVIDAAVARRRAQLRAAGRRGRRRQDAAWPRRSPSARSATPRRARARGPVRPVRRGQRVVADRRGVRDACEVDARRDARSTRATRASTRSQRRGRAARRRRRRCERVDQRPALPHGLRGPRCATSTRRAPATTRCGRC